MSSREQILSRIRQNKPHPRPVPAIPTAFDESVLSSVDLFARFRDALAFVGGRLVEFSDGSTLESFLKEQFPDAQRVATSVPLVGYPTVSVDSTTAKEELEQIDVAVLEGKIAVAENAAIWLPEAYMLHRALPFIAQHLVLVVGYNQLVRNMHEAYKLIDPLSLSYNVFIAGPSKTADIEQSLVVGAHGARSLTVIIR